MSKENLDPDDEYHYGDEEFDEDQSAFSDSPGSLSDPDDNGRSSPEDGDEELSNEEGTEDDEDSDDDDDEDENEGDNDELGGTLATYLGLLKDAEASDEYQTILDNSTYAAGDSKSKLLSSKDPPRSKHPKKSRIDGVFPDDGNLSENDIGNNRDDAGCAEFEERPDYSDILELLVIPEGHNGYNENKKDDSMTWSPAKINYDPELRVDRKSIVTNFKTSNSSAPNEADLSEKLDEGIETTPRGKNVKKNTLQSGNNYERKLSKNETEIEDIKQQIERLKKMQLLSKKSAKNKKIKDKSVLRDFLAAGEGEQDDYNGGRCDNPGGYGNKLHGKVEMMPNPDWEESDYDSNDLNKKDKLHNKSRRGSKLNSRRSSVNHNDNNNFDADERHRTKLAEMAVRKRHEDEEKENIMDKANARRKRFKEALLEKALRSRIITGDSVEHASSSNIPGKKSEVKALGLIGRKGAPILKEMETDEQIEEKKKCEEDRLTQISVLRKKFKEQHKIILQGLMNKKKEAEKKVEDELRNEEEKKRKRKIKAELLLVRRTESVTGQPLSTLPKEAGSEGRVSTGKALNLDKKEGECSDVDCGDGEVRAAAVGSKPKRSTVSVSGSTRSGCTSLPTSAPANIVRRGSFNNGVAVGSGLAGVRAHRSQSAEGNTVGGPGHDAQNQSRRCVKERGSKKERDTNLKREKKIVREMGEEKEREREQERERTYESESLIT